MTKRHRPEVLVRKVYVGRSPAFVGVDYTLYERSEDLPRSTFPNLARLYPTPQAARLAGQQEANRVAFDQRCAAARARTQPPPEAESEQS